MNKVIASPDEAVRDVKDGATVMVGGFGICGVPDQLLAALIRTGVRALHTISNNVGIDGCGMGLLLEAGMIASLTLAGTTLKQQRDEDDLPRFCMLRSDTTLKLQLRLTGVSERFRRWREGAAPRYPALPSPTT